MSGLKKYIDGFFVHANSEHEFNDIWLTAEGNIVTETQTELHEDSVEADFLSFLKKARSVYTNDYSDYYFDYDVLENNLTLEGYIGEIAEPSVFLGALYDYLDREYCGDNFDECCELLDQGIHGGKAEIIGVVAETFPQGTAMVKLIRSPGYDVDGAYVTFGKRDIKDGLLEFFDIAASLDQSGDYRFNLQVSNWEQHSQMREAICHYIPDVRYFAFVIGDRIEGQSLSGNDCFEEICNAFQRALMSYES